jgi:hypothetical protein
MLASKPFEESSEGEQGEDGEKKLGKAKLKKMKKAEQEKDTGLEVQNLWGSISFKDQTV